MDNRLANFVMFGSLLVGIIFWVQAPIRALETRITIQEEKYQSGSELSKQLQNIKDNDLHELHREINEAKDQVDQLKTAVAIMNNNLDTLIKKIK